MIAEKGRNMHGIEPLLLRMPFLHYNTAMGRKEQDTVRRPQVRRMKLVYFFSVMGIYLLSFAALEVVAQIFLTIFPVHPYITLAVHILLMAASVSVTKYIADIELKDRWIRH